MSEQRISTSLTLLLQLLTPVPLIALVMALAAEGLAAAVSALLLAVAGLWAYTQFIWPLRTVYVSRYGLRVLSRRSSVFVRYNNISRVTRILRRWDTIEVAFREPVPGLGPSLMFMAPPRVLSWTEPPIMRLLQDRASEVDQATETPSA